MTRLRLYYIAMVMRSAAALLMASLAVGLGSCARDVNGGETAVRYPAEVRLHFGTREQLAPDRWYYIVFNFSTAGPNPSVLNSPLEFISAEKRGRNWEMYIAYHKGTEGEAQMVTLQRSRLPTILPTAAGPSDVAVADFNADNIADIAVACKADNIVQLIRGRPTQIYDTTYFFSAEDIPESAGPQPLRLFTGDFDGDTHIDLLVLYGGDATTPANARVLSGDGAGAFTAGPEIPLGGPVVDALFQDFAGDSKLDLAVLTSGTGAGEIALRIFLNDGSGGFTAGQVYSVGVNPAALSSGLLDQGTTIDLAVANRGSGAQDGTVNVFFGGGSEVGDGTFTAGPTLSVPGPCSGVAVGRMFGNLDDVVVTYVGKYNDTAGTEHTGGVVGVFQNEQDAPFQSPPVVAPLGNSPASTKPNFVAAQDTSVGVPGTVADQRMDAVVLDGEPGSGGTTLYIQRGGRQNDTGGVQQFIWETESIAYLTGNEPGVIRFIDIDKNSVPDVIVPNSGGGQNGDSVCLFYGLGKNNYTSADIYWTDQLPQLLSAQPWLLDYSVGPNSIEMRLDPALFYDLSLLPPAVGTGFNVTFMTGTTGIDLQSNPDHLGVIRDFLTLPFNVQMVTGFNDDNQNHPLTRNDPGVAPSDAIDFWAVSVV